MIDYDHYHHGDDDDEDDDDDGNDDDNDDGLHFLLFFYFLTGKQGKLGIWDDKVVRALTSHQYSHGNPGTSSICGFSFLTVVVLALTH